MHVTTILPVKLGAEIFAASYLALYAQHVGPEEALLSVLSHSLFEMRPESSNLKVWFNLRSFQAVVAGIWIEPMLVTC